MKEMNRTPGALLMSFSGVDGAGKSTQINHLVSFFHKNGRSVRIVTFWDDVVALKNLREGAGHKLFKGDQGVGSPDRPITRRDKNVRSPLMTLIRMGFYLLDALSLRTVVRRTLRSKVDVIVFDRYLFDELANLNLSNPAVRFYVRLLLKLIPLPTISFILDADPEQAFARKPEYPLDFLHANRMAYLALSRLFDATVIPASTIDVAKTAVIDSVQRYESSVLPIPHSKAGEATSSLP